MQLIRKKPAKEVDSYTVRISLPFVDSAKSVVLKEVIGDGFVVSGNTTLSIRFFHLKDGKRFEISTDSFIFEFSPERDELIKNNLERQQQTS